MEEIENIKNELNEIKTARDNIKTALENEGETVTNDIRTYADTIPNVNKVKTVNSVEADENKNVQLDASKINVDDTAETKQTVKEVSDKIIDTDKAIISFYVNDTADNINISLFGKTVSNNNYNIDTNNPKNGGANSFLRNYDKSIMFRKINNSNGRIDLSVASENVIFDPQESGITSTKIAPAIRELKGKIDAISVPDYSVIETTVTEGYSKTYSLTKDGVEVGVKINIPKDLVVNKGNVKVVATAGTPYEGAVVGDKYLDIELNDPTQDHIYIPVKELVDVYTAGDGIEISADNVIKSKNSNLINGSAEGSIKGINAKNDNSTYTIGMYASAFGTDTTAYGENSHAEGRSTSADGNNAHAEGANSSARGENSHAEGVSTMATGVGSHAEGIYTVASVHYQHVQGRYNIEDTNNRYAHIVGNGSSNTARSNAHTIAWDGTGWFQGNVKVGGTSQNDTNAKQLATEEYVDDKYNTESITEIVSADKEPGYTFTFGKLCDSVMIFLNGEKLIAQKSSSQTIEEYSYIENKTDNKITSVTFTNDFTIITGDRIEAILINPSEISTANEVSNGGVE